MGYFKIEAKEKALKKKISTNTRGGKGYSFTSFRLFENFQN